MRDSITAGTGPDRTVEQVTELSRLAIAELSNAATRVSDIATNRTHVWQHDEVLAQIASVTTMIRLLDIHLRLSAGNSVDPDFRIERLNLEKFLGCSPAVHLLSLLVGDFHENPRTEGLEASKLAELMGYHSGGGGWSTQAFRMLRERGLVEYGLGKIYLTDKAVLLFADGPLSGSLYLSRPSRHNKSAVPSTTFSLTLPEGARVQSVESIISMPFCLDGNVDPSALAQETFSVMDAPRTPVFVTPWGDLSPPPEGQGVSDATGQGSGLGYSIPPASVEEATAYPFSPFQLKLLRALFDLAQNHPTKEGFYRTEIGRAVDYNPEHVGRSLDKLVQLGVVHVSEFSAHRRIYKLNGLGKGVVESSSQVAPTAGA